MLHDPKWNHGSLSGLITWLEGLSPDAMYNWWNTQDCLMCRYMGSTINESWSQDMRDIYSGTDKFKIARGHNPISSVQQTYGEALERAYEAQAALVAA